MPSRILVAIVRRTVFKHHVQRHVKVAIVDGARQVGMEWSGGEEHFFTGLKPELGHGYADYRMTAGTEYALSLSAGGTRITGLSAPPCLDASGNPYPGGLHLEFKQP